MNKLYSLMTLAAFFLVLPICFLAASCERPKRVIVIPDTTINNQAREWLVASGGNLTTDTAIGWKLTANSAPLQKRTQKKSTTVVSKKQNQQHMEKPENQEYIIPFRGTFSVGRYEEPDSALVSKAPKFNPIQCDSCIVKTMFFVHEANTQTNQNPFQCSICGDNFKNSESFVYVVYKIEGTRTEATFAHLKCSTERLETPKK